MNLPETLRRYDQTMRADPPCPRGYEIRDDGTVVRGLGDPSFILFARLDEASASATIAREVDSFRAMGRSVEWKVYAHDLPPDLGDLLAASGFVADPPEELMIRDLTTGVEETEMPPGLEIRQAVDESDLRDAATVQRRVAGPAAARSSDPMEGRLDDPEVALFIASREGRPVATGRVELPRGKEFASLWGGGTVPEHRGGGIYRALVAVRARLAQAGGYRYLTVDARPSTSQPILERQGFVPVGRVVGWIFTP